MLVRAVDRVRGGVEDGGGGRGEGVDRGREALWRLLLGWPQNVLCVSRHEAAWLGAQLLCKQDGTTPCSPCHTVF